MDFAYADPPYFGQGKKLYGSLHAEACVWDDKQSHINLVNDMTKQFLDGWALSCNPADLQWLIPFCPENIRVCVWAKTFHQIRPLASVQYAWEPVLVHGGRKVKHRKPMVRDWMACVPSRRKGLVGAKPDEFNVWILDLLGFDPSLDTLTDMFPGSGGMEKTIKVYQKPLTTK